MAPVGEVVISGADVVVCSLPGEAEDSSLKRRRSIVQELLESFFRLNRLTAASCCRYTAVVARAGKSRGYVLSTEAGVVGVFGEGGPDDLSVFE